MSVIAVLAVYNEEALIGQAVESLRGIGVDQVVVFDGAWEGFGDGNSTDGTAVIAVDLVGADNVIMRNGPWPSQEAKRTAMFRHCGARDGDYILVADADEVWEGTLPDEAPAGHMNVMVRCVGENDLPGIRGTWPHGDYCPDWKPELRCFFWNPTLECAWPGGYLDGDSFIQPYNDLHLWETKGASALPVLDGVRFEHHGNSRSPERIAQKIAYYEREHPKRRAWQAALSKAYAA